MEFNIQTIGQGDSQSCAWLILPAVLSVSIRQYPWFACANWSRELQHMRLCDFNIAYETGNKSPVLSHVRITIVRMYPHVRITTQDLVWIYRLLNRLMVFYMRWSYLFYLMQPVSHVTYISANFPLHVSKR